MTKNYYYLAIKQKVDFTFNGLVRSHAGKRENSGRAGYVIPELQTNSNGKEFCELLRKRIAGRLDNRNSQKEIFPIGNKNLVPNIKKAY